MKIWIDLSNAPHARFFQEIVQRIEKEGHALLLTARKFGHLETLIEELGMDAQFVGAHGGTTAAGKLDASVKRQVELARLVKKEKPEQFACKYSVEGMRVAYGLGIKSTLVVDNEHAFAQNNLCVPLATQIVLPRTSEPAFKEQFGARNFVPFEGVCEYAHVQHFKAKRVVLEKLGLEKNERFVVMRTAPLDAHYFKTHETHLDQLLEGLYEQYKIVAFPRNGVDSHVLQHERVQLVEDSSMDTLSLSYYASAFIGEGGTMTRESALLGTPTISCYPQEPLAVDTYLEKKGLMDRSLDNGTIQNFVVHAKKEKTREKLHTVQTAFEDPMEKVYDCLASV